MRVEREPGKRYLNLSIRFCYEMKISSNFSLNKQLALSLYFCIMYKSYDILHDIGEYLYGGVNDM